MNRVLGPNQDSVPALPDVESRDLMVVIGGNHSYRREFLGMIGLAPEAERYPMPDITYEIVQHDGGWAYKVNGVFSEPFSTHADALAAAQAAAQGQEIHGHTETIEYEDDEGQWHTEIAGGRDRPHTVVKDVETCDEK